MSSRDDSEAPRRAHYADWSDAVVAIAGAAAATGQFDLSARLLGDAEQRLKRTGSTHLFFHMRFMNAMESTRRHLGTRRYQQELSRGALLDAGEFGNLVRSISFDCVGGAGGVGGVGGTKREALSQREREVLSLLAEGRSDREIAETMSISDRTAKSYVARILVKIGVPSRTAAAALAIREGLD